MSFTSTCAPAQLAELYFATQSAAILINNFACTGVKDNLLLFGPTGTGKSQTALVLLQHRITNQLGVSPNLFVVHAKKFESADQIDNLFGMQLCAVDFAFVIIDEFDELSRQQMLDVRALIDKRKVIAGLIATTNHIGKIDPAMRSRFNCVQIDCPPPGLFLPRVQSYLRQHQIVLPDNQVRNVIAAAGPDIRAIGRAVDSLILTHRTQLPKASALKIVQQPASTQSK